MLGVEVFRPLRDLRVLLHQGMLGLSAARGVLALLATTSPVRDEGGAATDLRRLAPTVAFDDVTFRYPGGRGPAHARLSFSVQAGERVAIVGPSGSGKSTVARLLLRFHDPQSGRVLVGGRDVRDLRLADLRALMAVVHQDTYLFHGTVAENLRMGRPDATAAELEAAAREANADEFIARLPQGYETVVGERGVRLSGGQRQRIAIARALLRDAPILILDEALSSVDAESEALIQAALDRLMAGRTTLIFAHRLSSVIGADRILVLDGGRVVESGSHAELIVRGGAYARLMAAQVAERVDEDGALAPRPTVGPGASPDGTSSETEPAEAILTASGRLGWARVLSVLLGLSRGYRGRLVITFLLGVARVAALIGVGAVSALTVLAVQRGRPVGGWLAALFVVAPLAGLLHWLESWLAHDVAYRLLADMRLRFFRALDALAPAYLTRRRTGDLVGVATHDIELIEYFFAHTIAPAFVGVLVPAVVLGVLLAHGWPMALVLAPFLGYVALGPVWGRARIDRLSARAREAAGALNAHAVDSIQGLAEVAAFQQEAHRDAQFAARAVAYAEVRMPFLRDLARQGALQEIATGLGGVAVAVTGAALAAHGTLEPARVPLLTLLALSAFVPGVGDRADRTPAGRHLRRHPAPPRGARRARDRHRRAGRAAARRRRRAGARDGAGQLQLSRSPSARARRRLAVRPRGEHGRARRAFGRREDDGRQPVPALLGSDAPARSVSTATISVATGWTTCERGSRSSPRTPTSSTTRSARTSGSHGPAPPTPTWRRRSSARRSGSSSNRCPRGSTRWWGSGARSSRAASASGSPSRAPS